jgi:ribosomal protein S1
MKETWDYKKRTAEVFFDELLIGEEYSFTLYNWFEDLNRQYKQERSVTIKLKATSDADCYIKNGICIKKGTDCLLHFWQGFYAKWANCQDSDVDEFNKGDFITVKFKKLDPKKKWIILSIKVVKVTA